MDFVTPLIFANFDHLAKNQDLLIWSFPRKRESSLFDELHAFWIPAYAGMTTFYEATDLGRI